jgi:hypothetical protein
MYLPVVQGTRWYGRVDSVPGLFYVATRFHHLQFLPTFPLGSYLVFDDGTEQTGLFLGTNRKSVVMAYVRTLIVAAAFVSGLFLAFGLGDWMTGRPGYPAEVILPLFAAVPAWIFLFWLTYRLTRASDSRALWWAGVAGLDVDAVRAFLAARARGEPAKFWVPRPEPYQAGGQMPSDAVAEHFQPSPSPAAAPDAESQPDTSSAQEAGAPPEGVTKPGDEPAIRHYP